MADLTRAEVADRALEAIGVKAAGQDSSAEDANRAMESFDTVHARLRKEGLAPFATSAVPDWAQSSLIHLTALDLSAAFGITGARMQTVQALASTGYRELAKQVAGFRQPIPITAEYF